VRDDLIELGPEGTSIMEEAGKVLTLILLILRIPQVLGLQRFGSRDSLTKLHMAVAECGRAG